MANNSGVAFSLLFSIDNCSVAFTRLFGIYTQLDLAYCITSSGLAHIIGSHETRSVEGDPMIWANPRDVILYARSSYYYNDMFIIYL